MTVYHHRLVARNTAGATTGGAHTLSTPLASDARTGPATGIGPTSATLPDSVDPRGHSTSWYFEHGASTGYGLAESGHSPPRVLFVSRTIIALPLTNEQRRRWDAFSHVCEPRVLAVAERGSSADTDRRFSLWRRLPRFDGPLFYLALPYRIRRELRRFRPEVAVVQGVHQTAAFMIARALTAAQTKLVLDIHGDWRTTTRLFGSPKRRLLNPLNDWVGTFAVRRADAIRVVSAFTARLVRELGREPTAIIPPYSDSVAFRARPIMPLPAEERILFVGVLELYKGIDILAHAWRDVVAQRPHAVLHIVGDGSRRDDVERLATELPRNVIWTRKLTPEGVAEAMDASRALCLPSRIEGLGRVAYEALARGRPVVGVRAGGIPDIIADRVTGILVDPEDAQLTEALVEILANPATAAEYGRRGPETSAAWLLPADEFAARFGRLFESLLATPVSRRA